MAMWFCRKYIRTGSWVNFLPPSEAGFCFRFVKMVKVTLLNQAYMSRSSSEEDENAQHMFAFLFNPFSSPLYFDAKLTPFHVLILPISVWSVMYIHLLLSCRMIDRYRQSRERGRHRTCRKFDSDKRPSSVERIGRLISFLYLFQLFRSCRVTRNFQNCVFWKCYSVYKLFDTKSGIFFVLAFDQFYFKSCRKVQRGKSE